MKFFRIFVLLVAAYSQLGFSDSEIAVRAKKRIYPGGQDESDLKVQASPAPVRRPIKGLKALENSTEEEEVE